ncbi:MAG TPA: helix-turn-helix domain-containing protein [Cellulomonas sp.]
MSVLPAAEPAPRRATRRDAVRNDERVLDAARSVLAERGPQVSMEDIAARAGVGVGTIYRRFPGKDALLDAVAGLLVAEIDHAADDALADPDPGEGLESFLMFVGTFTAKKRRYATELMDRVGDQRVGARTTEKIASLTQAAVEAGALAPGTRGEDVKALVVALRGVVSSTPPGEDETWRRFLHIHLTGLRSAR